MLVSVSVSVFLYPACIRCGSIGSWIMDSNLSGKMLKVDAGGSHHGIRSGYQTDATDESVWVRGCWSLIATNTNAQA